jgi:hypothetical protein
VKKKTKRLLRQLGHDNVDSALQHTLKMRIALRVIHIWAEHEDGDLLSLTPQHVIDTCMYGLVVKK